METSSKSSPPGKSKVRQLRNEERVRRTLPIKVLNDDSSGKTLDISPSGVYFEIDKHYEVGSMVALSIDFDGSPSTRLNCVGTIVRVEHRGSKVGVAVRQEAGESKTLTAALPEKIK